MIANLPMFCKNNDHSILSRTFLRPTQRWGRLREFLHIIHSSCASSDLVDQPVGFSNFGHVLDRIGVEDGAGEAVTIPVFSSGELRQISFGESWFVRHGWRRTEAMRLPVIPPTRERSK